VCVCVWVCMCVCLYIIYIYITTRTWTGKNYESLHCCGKFAFTPDDTEER